MHLNGAIDDVFVDQISRALLGLKKNALGRNHLAANSSCRQFFSNASPTISLEEYITRIDKGTRSANNICFFLYALVLVKRYLATMASLSISLFGLSLHRLFLTAFTIVNKVYSDTFYTNAYYAMLGGISVKELDEHETTFLKFLNWNIMVHKEEVDTLAMQIKAPFDH